MDGGSETVRLGASRLIERRPENTSYWSANVPGQIAAGIMALAASALVTVAYHAGYPEFQGHQMVKPVIGNSVCTLAYVLTANPIAAAASHVAMHVAAVLRGPERAVQLPPHYAAAQ